jgi:hypothetical protein
VNQKDIELIKSRLHQVKARFNLTFKKLLNEHFFNRTESLQEFTRLTAENIESCIKAAYDLRSKYVHTGIDFSHWLVPHRAVMNEIQLRTPPYRGQGVKKGTFRSANLYWLRKSYALCIIKIAAYQ